MTPQPAPRPTKDAVTKAASLHLNPRLSGARAFEHVARACLAHADANEALLHVDGPHEALHQFRVGYRRLRSLFSLARQVHQDDPMAARLKLELRFLTQTFGPARDLDVFREGHDLTVADARRLEIARQQAYAVALGYLHSPHWRHVRRDLDLWLDRAPYREALPTAQWSGRAMAAEAMERRLKRILKDGKNLAKLEPEPRHKVRIECKKVRYGAQFFGTLWPGRGPAVTRTEKILGEIQDRLGALNDVVAWTELEERLELVDAERPHADHDAEIAAAQALVDELREVTPFWSRTWNARRDLPPPKPPAPVGE